MKRNIIQFLVFMRNGIAFCTTWFLIIWLIYCHIFNYDIISVSRLTKMLFLIVGGVFIFSVLFTQIVIKKWGFVKRLSCFMVLISIYECMGFYLIGFFKGTGDFIQWSIFIGIVCILYFICIAIYLQYSKRQGEIYTSALEQYKLQRRTENE